MFDEEIASIITLIRAVRGILADTTLSLFVGAIILLSYLYKQRSRFDEKDTIVNAVLVFTSSIAILPGFAVMLLGFDKATCQLINIEQKVFFVGGFVLVATGIQGLRRNYRQ